MSAYRRTRVCALVTFPSVGGRARLLVPVNSYSIRALMHAQTHTRIVMRPNQLYSRCVPQAEMKILDKTINVEREKRKQEYVAHPARLWWLAGHMHLNLACST
jgi:hypothetical protein